MNLIESLCFVSVWAGRSVIVEASKKATAVDLGKKDMRFTEVYSDPNKIGVDS